MTSWPCYIWAALVVARAYLCVVCSTPTTCSSLQPRSRHGQRLAHPRSSSYLGDEQPAGGDPGSSYEVVMFYLPVPPSRRGRYGRLKHYVVIYLFTVDATTLFLPVYHVYVQRHGERNICSCDVSLRSYSPECYLTCYNPPELR